MVNTVQNVDCLIGMQSIPDKSIDMILCDLPYGTTACKWDVIIPFEPLWKQYERVIKDNGAIVLFSSQPFTSNLIMSNAGLFKYQWYWKKERGTGFITSNIRPLMIVEDACVFYKKQPLYNPDKKKLNKPYRHVLPAKKGQYQGMEVLSGSIKNGERVYKEYTHETPHQLLEFSRDGGCRKALHPTQKPVALFEYLIKTYTSEGETVLDNCMGSGTTAIACINTNRNYIGFEKDETYFNIIQDRIKKHTVQTELFAS
jgi:site-specific DNA-methyltransferase (adenine-specific)